MDDHKQALNELFASPDTELSPELYGELQSIVRLYSISPQELFYKWESYCIKMGSEETKLSLKSARDLKKDIQDALERESRGKAHPKMNERRTIGATPKAGRPADDVFGMIDGLNFNTPRPGPVSAAKRKSNFDTPTPKSTKSTRNSSPGAGGHVQFHDRPNAGVVVETLNQTIDVPSVPEQPPATARIKLKANTEMSKFGYKTMAMKLTEASEILDDRIDEFMSIVQMHHQLDDSAFGSPVTQSTSEVVAVGRIASDAGEGRLVPASLVLETSRRTGAGLRVPLRVDSLPGYHFFPGKIVALKGTNASGDFFQVSEVLDTPLLPPPASLPEELDVHNQRLAGSEGRDGGHSTRPLTILVASGPYTTQDRLDFSAFDALMDVARETMADSIILAGPFIDTDHPLIRSGDFDLPSEIPVSPDQATLTDLFRHYISRPLWELTKANPSVSILLCPSVRDAISKHVAWPQDRLPKKEFGLPKQASVVTNPVTLSMNEAVIGISTQDVLDALRMSECVGGKAKQENIFARLSRQIIEQRHFFPIVPPPGAYDSGSGGVSGDGMEDVQFQDVSAMLDVPYLKLGEWLNVRPDILVTPSVLTPFSKVRMGKVKSIYEVPS
ncbi:DNA polymerase alpha/primase associated subunit [Eremomyces bilateralis CBS 781.70]|uniref:DNA polymerase alpha subunit B n=1 Tax=Eremomyces bilateralis CBS 781.70 TaxID=1392243 RepID=A0A6G1GAW5_9PEZI|nr:DNA polymerase alpha/primase associated subunit [Eremomyces bilateralis CBS 781.70]KAF1815051.1 DNA polymerase alpha/primase associated subunit [Eremomyces bilateralis CBS 781.70]